MCEEYYSVRAGGSLAGFRVTLVNSSRSTQERERLEGCYPRTINNSRRSRARKRWEGSPQPQRFRMTFGHQIHLERKQVNYKEKRMERKSFVCIGSHLQLDFT